MHLIIKLNAIYKVIKRILMKIQKSLKYLEYLSVQGADIYLNHVWSLIKNLSLEICKIK